MPQKGPGKMELWMVALLLLLLAVGIFLLLRIYSRNIKKGLLIAAMYFLGAAVLACIFYVAMTFLLVE